jgi:hypothetical protein
VAVRQNVYERQAKFSVILGIVGALFTLAGVFFIRQAFDWESRQVVYDPQSLRLPGIAGALGVGLAGGGAAFLLGWQSAGQRTNKRNKLSWTGFFLGAAVIALAASAGVVFWLSRFPFHKTVPGGG